MDKGAAVNILTASVMKKLSKQKSDLIETNMTMTDLAGGETSTLGVIPVDLTVGSVTSLSAFFASGRVPILG